MIKAFCKKRTNWIKDGKAVNYCVKVKCKWLKFKLTRIEKKIRKRGKRDDEILQM